MVVYSATELGGLQYNLFSPVIGLSFVKKRVPVGILLQTKENILLKE